MNVYFSPQRSSFTRTSFYFDLENRCIHAFYAKGREENVRRNGGYYPAFIQDEKEKYIIRLDFIEEDLKKTPISFITGFSIKEKLSDSSISLLKQYGVEDGHDFSISFPAPCVIANSMAESEAPKLTSLSEFEKLIQIWRGQLSEILDQIHNLCVYLNNEYLAVNNDHPPLGSPISIRSFKTSILSNTVLYIENIANFYTSLALEIDALCLGAPFPVAQLTEKELDKIAERDGRFQSLERKLHFSVNKINKLTGSNVNLDKDRQWDNFIAIKEKRNSLTHAKIQDYKRHVRTSLDHMISSVKITDMDLMSCIEAIIWINRFTDELFDKISVKKDFHDSSFNDCSAISILKLISDINQVPYSEAFVKNNLTDPFSFLR